MEIHNKINQFLNDYIKSYEEIEKEINLIGISFLVYFTERANKIIKLITLISETKINKYNSFYLINIEILNLLKIIYNEDFNQHKILYDLNIDIINLENFTNCITNILKESFGELVYDYITDFLFNESKLEVYINEKYKEKKIIIETNEQFVNFINKEIIK